MKFGRIIMGPLLICIILTILYSAGMADECEIIFPDTPPLNLDSIAKLVPHSFLDVVLTTPEGETIVQPGYLISADGKLLTCRSCYLKAHNAIVMSSEGESLKVINKLVEDALADLIMLKITLPKQKMKPMEPRYYFPDIGEELGVIIAAGTVSTPLSSIKVLKNCEDPLYGFVSRLEDSDDDSFNGKMVLNYDSKVLGIIRSHKADGRYRNFLFPFSIIHIDGPRQSSRNFVSKFSADLSPAAQMELLNALQMYWSREYSAAHQALAEMDEKYAGNPLVILYTGYSLLNSGDVDAALENADEALLHDQSVAEIYLFKANCYRRMLQIGKARIYADSALQLNESSIEALEIITRAMLANEKYENARDYVEKISKAQKDNAFCIATQAMIKFYQYDREKACELLHKALTISRSDPDIYAVIYNMQRRLRKTEEALEAIRRGIAMAPDEGEPYYFLGNYFLNKEKTDSAIWAYMTALEKSPLLFDAYEKLGKLLLENGSYSDAITYLKKAKEIYPGTISLRRNLGACYAKEGDYELALKEFEDALKINPGSKITHYDIGLLYLDMQKYDSSEVYLKLCYDLGYRHRNLFFQLGRLYHELGNAAKADEYYENLRSISLAEATKLHNLIIGREGHAVDSTMDLRLRKYFENIKKSLVKVECLAHFARISRLFGYSYRFLAEGELSWGCRINEAGDIFTPSRVFDCDEKLLLLTPAVERKDEESSAYREIELHKSKTCALVDEFAIFSTRYQDDIMITEEGFEDTAKLISDIVEVIGSDQITMPKVAQSLPLKGDSVLVITDPIMEYSDYCIGSVLAVNSDPFLNNIIVIQTPFDIDRTQGLILNMNGELAGFLTSIKIPGTNLNFALCANSCCRYYYHGRYNPERFDFEMERKHKQGENFAIGQVYLWLGNYDQAREAFELARGEGGSARDPEILIYLAFIDWKNGNPEQAEDLFKKTIQWNEDCYEAYYTYGLFLREQNRPDEAEKNFKLAIRHNKYHAMAHYQLSEMYIVSGKADKAQGEYNDLKKLDPVMAEKLLGR
jgi:tetratricopeptide (TPR) repeat protein